MADTKPADDKATEAKTKNAKAKGSDGPVLVFSRRGGPYHCVSTEIRKDKPTGAGRQDPAEQFNIHRVVILPGLTLVDRESWDRCRSQPGFRSRVDDGELEVVGGHSGEWRNAWDAAKPVRRFEWISATGNVETLKAILADEVHGDIADALREQIEDCTSDARAKQAGRRAQRTHNRGRRGPARKGLLS